RELPGFLLVIVGKGESAEVCHNFIIAQKPRGASRPARPGHSPTRIQAFHRGQGRPVPAKRPIHLFTGLVHCTCGGRFAVPSSIPNKYVCGTCRRKIPIADLERLFQAELERFVLSPEAVLAHLADADQALRGKQELLTMLHAERDSLALEA